MGNILRNSIVKEKDASRSFDDWIKNDRDIWETTVGNEFIIADQVKKDAPNKKNGFDINAMDKFDIKYNQIVLDELFIAIDKLSDEDIKMMS